MQFKALADHHDTMVPRGSRNLPLVPITLRCESLSDSQHNLFQSRLHTEKWTLNRKILLHFSTKIKLKFNKIILPINQSKLLQCCFENIRFFFIAIKFSSICLCVNMMQDCTPAASKLLFTFVPDMKDSCVLFTWIKCPLRIMDAQVRTPLNPSIP